MINEIISGSEEKVAAILGEIIISIHANGPVNAADFEKLALIKKFHPSVFATRETELLYLMGLFYKVEEPKNMMEEVYSIFADAIEDETGKRFTPSQADAYKHIRDKKYFSFSAPTSAGKSFLFRELINQTQGDILIILPSRALIAEYLAAVKELVDSSVLVLQFIDNINQEHVSRRVFIITPERGRELFKYKNDFNFDLMLFDEAQLSEDKTRGIGFDAFVRRVAIEFPDTRKVFAHPFVNNPEAQLKKHGFTTRAASVAYDQNAVGKIFLALDGGQYAYFSPYNDRGRERVPCDDDPIEEILTRNGTVLIYASKSKLYGGEYLKQYRKYLHYCRKLTDATALEYVERLRSYIGANKYSKNKSSLIVALMERGIVLHHGSMPLKMRLIIEQFVRSGYARICFATSTLNQGINMPFDAVYIDNYRKMDVLTLKNLIGRAGRSTTGKNRFEYGYAIVNKRNVKTFSQCIDDKFELGEKSLLEDVSVAADEDNIDLVEAMPNNAFDDDTRLTDTQMDRLRKGSIDDDAKYILDSLLVNNRVLKGNEYYETLTKTERNKLKDAFKTLYLIHLRRTELTSAEQSVLSTAIPIMLWHIQGRTFKEILALRYSYLTQRTEQNKIRARARQGEITDDEARALVEKLRIRFSQVPSPLPNKLVKVHSEFGEKKPISDLDYDTLVFDTYDYLDKVISLSLADPLCAAFKVYYENSGDERALVMINYIRHGTNDPMEIWLLRYGFAFEDIEWIKPLVKSVDEKGIEFFESAQEEKNERYEVIGRYL